MTKLSIEHYQSTELISLLAQWQQAGIISALDVAFVRFLWRNAEASLNSTTLLLAALVSSQLSKGHVCLPLAELLDAPNQFLNIDTALLYQDDGTVLADPAALLRDIDLKQLYQCLLESQVVQHSQNTLSLASQGLPLVLTDKALYLHRYWRYEQFISTELSQLMQAERQPLALSNMPLAQWLDELFPATRNTASIDDVTAINWQKLACANTLRSRFSVITGGPGTGKTYTVVRLLALLQRMHTQSSADELIIKLAAPTGKAAARLKESIQAAADSLSELPAAWATALSKIKADSSTLHRLLGVQHGTRQFKHRRGQPLALDVLIVDEASMVDIELMQALLAALPPTARLVLLGDKDQLASVEAGAVLGQLCAGAEEGGYRTDTMQFLQQFCPQPIPTSFAKLDGPNHLQHVMMLRVSRRFDDKSGIGALAKAVNQAQLPQLKHLLQMPNTFSDIALLQNTASQPDESHAALFEQLQQLCQQGFNAYWQVILARPAKNCTPAEQDMWARAVLTAYQGFQLLTPVREGHFGVTGLNHLVQNALTFLPSVKETNSWFEGRPIMITANDYNLNLRNGDIGMVLCSAITGEKRAVFIDSDNQVRWILPSRLNEIETVFAMTVHKSQGSEFSHAVMILPDRDNPVLSRELVYTGITRAAKKLTLVVPRWHVLEQAVNRRTERSGYLHL